MSVVQRDEKRAAESAIVFGVHDSNQVNTGDSSIREARFRIYSCVFCEFVKESLLEDGESEKVTETQVEDDEKSFATDGAFEAKYLFHLSSVHGLSR